MLVELGLVEQRLMAVREVLDGATVTDVAKRNGVTRQTVHNWLRSYASSGVAGLIDKSSKPETCPHQMTPVVEARIVEMRRTHPRWGPRSIRTHLAGEGATPLPGRSSIYRALVRHRLLEPKPRKRSRSDYKRWERSKSMELWQMDIVGRFYLADGTEVKVVTGIDDHSATASVPGSWPERRPGRCVTPSPSHCDNTVPRTRSSPKTAKCSPPDSAPDQGRCCSTASATTSASSTG